MGLLKNFKTEVAPTEEQVETINKTIGVCRFVYNLYINKNKELHESRSGFMSGVEFSKWLNNVYLLDFPEHIWIKEVSSKSVKRSIMNAERAFKNFFNGKCGFPKFKKKRNADVKMYFVKNNPKDCLCERHRIKIPTLGWVKLKEKGFIPTTSRGYSIISGTVSKKAGRYYVSVLIDIPNASIQNIQFLNGDGLGIDLGVKEFAVMSNGVIKKNINKTAAMKKIEKKLNREQRCLSKKYEKAKCNKSKAKGESTQRNIQKQILKVQKLYQRIFNIRTDYINKTIAEIVKAKPSYVAIEDLNVSGMIKNRRLAKAISSQNFYDFKLRLIKKCKEVGIEVRIVDRWFPSSKLCHKCGSIKKDLKLSDREYICECGYRADRDFNASLNLRDAIAYKIA